MHSLSFRYLCLLLFRCESYPSGTRKFARTVIESLRACAMTCRILVWVQQRRWQRTFRYTARNGNNDKMHPAMMRKYVRLGPLLLPAFQPNMPGSISVCYLYVHYKVVHTCAQHFAECQLWCSVFSAHYSAKRNGKPRNTNDMHIINFSELKMVQKRLHDAQIDDVDSLTHCRRYALATAVDERRGSDVSIEPCDYCRRWLFGSSAHRFSVNEHPLKSLPQHMQMPGINTMPLITTLSLIHPINRIKIFVCLFNE